MVTAESLFEQAMELDEAEREALAERLYASLERVDPDWERAWMEEAERRMDAYRAGRERAIPLEEARAVLFGPLERE